MRLVFFVENMKYLQKNWIIGLVVAAVVLIGGAYLVSNNNQSTQETGTQEEGVEKVKASIEIRYGEDQVDAFGGVEIEEGKTALDLTKKVVEVETSGEGEMAFVTKIKNREADSSNNEFWELLINGESSQVGAGSYKVKDGDKIDWKISKF